MTSTILPPGFEDLTQFVPDWAHSTELARNKFRVGRPMSELTAFYDTMMPRLEEIAGYLDDYPLDTLPRDCANLLELALMTMEVAPAIEYYGSPDVPDAVEYEKFRIYPVQQKFTAIDDQ